MVNPPIIDHRVYTIVPRRMNEFLEIFERLAMPVLQETLGQPIAFYTSWVGQQNQLVHLWGYDSLDEYEKRSAARDSDPRFHEYLVATQGMITRQETQLIKSVNYLNKWI